MATVEAATVTIEDLAEKLGIEDDDTQAADLLRAWNSMRAEVDGVLAQAFKDVPAAIVDQLYIEVGMAMFKRTDAPDGQSQYLTPGDPQPARAPRDPLNQAWPILRRYVLPF